MALSSRSSQARIHVDNSLISGADDGSSWPNAYRSLSDALGHPGITADDQVWVHGNTGRDYKPDPAGGSAARTDTFSVPNGVRLYGGFDGTEGSFDDRAGLFADTVLSGGILTGTVTDNCYHVVTVEGGGDPTVVDGFVIEKGYADGSGTDQARGAGLIAAGGHALLENLTIQDHYAEAGGAGIFFNGGQLDMVFCRIDDNVTSGQGGGLWVLGVEATSYVYNTVFEDNNACQGGGVFVQIPYEENKYIFAQCLLFDNFAGYGGGAYLDINSSSEWRDCTFAFNNAGTNSLGGSCSGGGGLGGGIYDGGGGGIGSPNSATIVRNTVLWENTAPNSNATTCSASPCTLSPNIESLSPGTSLPIDVQYSDLSHPVIGVLYPGTGNINFAPLFVDVVNENFQLGAASLVADAGLNSERPRDYFDFDGDSDTTELLPLDLALATRVVNTDVDMGAYERQ